MNRVLTRLLGFGCALAAAGCVLAAFGASAAESVNVKPGDSLIAARDEARKMQKPCVIELATGIYPLTETLVLTAEDSDVTWRAAKGAKPVVTGGRRVTGWTKNADGTWSAAVPKGNPYRLLTVNGVRAVRCRAPNRGEFLAAGETEKLGINHTLGDGRHPKLVYDPKDIDFAKLSDPAAGEIRIFHWWVDSHLKIGSVDAASNTVTFAIPANKYTGKMSAGGKMCRYVAENFRSLLDQPGEWYLDAAAGRVDYLPRPDEDLAKAEVLLAETTVLVRLDGDPTDEAKRVRNVTFSGIAFADAHAEMSPKDPINDEQGSALIGAAISVGGARNVTFEDCLFRDLCGYAVDVVDGSRDVTIRRSPMLRIGAGAVRADGAAANGDPRRMTRGVTVEDCEIGPYGLDWASAVGVLVKNAAGCRIAHNRIHDGFYTAVSLGWNWGYADSVARDNVVEWNVIEDIGKGLLNDMGGIYTLGLSPGTVLRGNVIRRIGSWSYGGHALYQDEGSQGILVEKNLLVDSPEPIGIHYAREVTYRNNVFAFHTTSEYMVWCGFHERHVTAYFYDNIFYYTHGVPLGGGLTNPKPYEFPTNPRAVQLGGKVPIRTDHVKADWNLYYNPNGREAKADAALWDGHENKNSVFADPKFVDAQGGDFRLKSDSPVFALGFEPVDWSKAGLRIGRAVPRPRNAALRTADGPLVQAHRGGRHEYDDNAAGGFRRSLEQGIRGFEMDVRFSKDRELVVMHDGRAERTTDGKGPIEKLTYAELAKMRLRGCGESVPRAADVFAAFRGRDDFFIEIEMKAYADAFYTPEVLEDYCRKLNQLARETLAEGTYAFTCFSTNTLATMRRIDARAPLGLITWNLGDEQFAAAKALRCCGIAAGLPAVDKALVDRAHAEGLLVCLWMVQDLPSWLDAKAKGADRITSDWPIALQRAIECRDRTVAALPLTEKTDGFYIRDPYVLADGGRYYLYASSLRKTEKGAVHGVSVRESSDLKRWTPPRPAMTLPAGFDCTAVWASEVHKYGGAYWMFATLTQSTNVCRIAALSPECNPRNLVPRGTWVFKAPSPCGPFVAVKDGPVPPRESMTLDGTLYVEDGKPYMVYCHEWCQMGNGTIEYAPLKPDFTGLAEAPRTLLNARGAMKGAAHVTDGPFFWRTAKSGRLHMIWSNFIDGSGYCVLVRTSASGKIAGPWSADRLLYKDNGGHGMIFKGPEDRPYLTLHQPNASPHERMRLYELVDDGETLLLK